MVRAIQELSKYKDSVVFSLLDVDPESETNLLLEDMTGLSYKARYIAPDVKFTKAGDDAVCITRLGDGDTGKGIYACDQAIMTDLRAIITEDTNRAFYSPYSNLDPRFLDADNQFSNGTGYSIGTDGFCIITQKDGLTVNAGLLFPAFNRPVGTRTVTQGNQVSSVIKINLDCSHPSVVEYMNNLKVVSLYSLDGKSKANTDVLVNIDSKSNVPRNVDVSTFSSYDGYLQSSIDFTSIAQLWKMVSIDKFSKSLEDTIINDAAFDGVSISLSEIKPWVSSDIPKKVHRFSTLFRTYKTLTDGLTTDIINNRLVIGGSTIDYSAFSNTNLMNVGYKKYLRSNNYTSVDLEYLRESGFPANFSINENDPQNYMLRDEEVTNISLLDVRSNNEGVITTNKRLLRASGNGSLQIPVLTEIDDIGCDKNALTKYTSSIISSQGGDVRQTLYSDRVNGFVSNLINEETELPPIIDMVQMITKHRVILCLHEKQEDTPQQITCFSLGSEAQIKGLTKWVSNFMADKFVKVSEDKVLLVGTEGTRIIDFDKGFTGDDYDQEAASEIKPIEWVIRPTPIRFNTDNSISVMKPHSIADLAIGATGQVKFDVILENYVNGKRIVKTVRETVRGIGDVDNYTGVVVFRGLPSIASELPVLEIRGTGSVTEISSIDMMLRS